MHTQNYFPADFVSCSVRFCASTVSMCSVVGIRRLMMTQLESEKRFFVRTQHPNGKLLIAQNPVTMDRGKGMKEDAVT